MESCLEDELVYDFVSGQLTPDARSQVDGHLDDCDECRTLVADIARSAEGEDSESASAVESEDRIALARGSMVGRYVLVDVLGQGAMGIVFAGYDPALNRKAAIKLLHVGASDESGYAQERLLREAQAMARLSHPNVVTIYEVGQVDEAVYLAMELVLGDTLAVWLEAPERSLEEVQGAFGQAALGLQAAHEAGLVHRDFKPDNVLVSVSGRVQVTDFGLAWGDDSVAETIRESSVVAAAVDVGKLSQTITQLGTILAKRRGLIGAAAALCLVGIAGGYLVSAGGSDAQVVAPCQGAEAQFDQVWTAEKRELMKAALASPRKSDSHVAMLADGEFGSWREDWISQHRTTCEATRVISARAQRELGTLKDAQDSIDRAILSAVRSGSDRDLSIAWIEAVSIWGEVGAYNEALKQGKLAQASLARISGSLRLQSTLNNNLGVVYYHLQEWDKARVSLEKNLSLRTSLFGPDDTRIARAHTNLGNLERATGQYSAALSHHERAFEIDRKALGETHPVLGRHLHNQAGVRRMMKQVQLACGDLFEGAGDQDPGIRSECTRTQRQEPALTGKAQGQRQR